MYLSTTSQVDGMLPAILYGKEAILLTNSLKEINAAKMRMLRFMMGLTTLNQTKPKKLGIH